MPQFAPGEVKTAIAPITARPAGMNCEAELFLGPDELTKVATSGRIPFVSTGASQSVSLPIAMPSEPGAYHGYIDVFTNGIHFLAYKTTEDIVIKGITLGYTSPKKAGSNSWEVNVYNPQTKTWSGFPYPKLIGESYALDIPDTVLVQFRESYNRFFDHYVYGPFLFEGLVSGVYTWDAAGEKLNGVGKINLAATTNSWIVKGTVSSYNEDRHTIRTLVESSTPSVGPNIGNYFTGTYINARVDPKLGPALVGITANFTISMVPVIVSYGQDWEFEVTNISYDYGYPDAFYSLEYPIASTWSEYPTCNTSDYGWIGDRDVLLNCTCVSWSRGACCQTSTFGVWSTYGISGTVVIRKYDLEGHEMYFAQPIPIPLYTKSVKMILGQGFQIWFKPLGGIWPGVNQAPEQGWRMMWDELYQA